MLTQLARLLGDTLAFVGRKTGGTTIERLPFVSRAEHARAQRANDIAVGVATLAFGGLIVAAFALPVILGG